MSTEKEFGSDGQAHDVDKPTVKPVVPAKPAYPADPFEASEPGAASQRTGTDKVKGPSTAPSADDPSKLGSG